ncbi:MAG: hypothetical protein QM564_03875 [Bergeyella sp.]
MIDYIKTYFPDKNEIFEIMNENYNLEKTCHYRLDKVTNEKIVTETYKKYFENMEFKVTDKQAYLHNSIHHFYNKMVYGIDGNYNDFNHSSFVRSIEFLEEQIKYPVGNLPLSQCLEFGLNLTVPFDLDHFILNESVLYDFCPASLAPPPSEEQVYKKFSKGNYRLRIYHKGRQQCNGANILRIEVKFLDKRDFNKNGIIVLNHLRDKDNLTFLYDKLYSLVNFKLMCIDRIEDSRFSPYIKKRLYEYCNHKYWAELDKDEFKSESKKVYPYFERKKIVEHKKILLTLMDNKFTELLDN